MFITRSKAVAFLLGAATVILAACSEGYSASPPWELESSEVMVTGSSSHKFPAESMTDWTSYMDQVLVVSVISEKQIPPNRGDAARGEGIVGREVLLRIERSLWNREGAPSADSEITVRTWGWVMHDYKLRPITALGDTRVEVGKRYIVPIVSLDSDISEGKAWVTLSNGGSIMLLDGDTVAPPDFQPERSAPFVKELFGKSVDEIATLIANTPPDPLAAKYMALEPEQRFRAVLKERNEGEETPLTN